MSASQLFIPDRIKVGFQNRDDTYTKRLGFVVCFDQQGNLRKERSWKHWIDDKLPTPEFDNIPTEGFVLNKAGGGVRRSYGWHARNEFIRVYDPRDFEFEISVDNLLFILRECDCYKGKGLEGQFVYAWDRDRLVLLPVISDDYQNSLEFTALKLENISAKELIPGATYLTKDQKSTVYLGRFNYFFIYNSYSSQSAKRLKGKEKKHLFWQDDHFDPRSDVKHLAKCTDEQPIPNYAELVDQYNKSSYGSAVKRLFLRERDPDDNTKFWAIEMPGGQIRQYVTSDTDKEGVALEIRHETTYEFQDGVLTRNSHYYDRHAYAPDYATRAGKRVVTSWYRPQYSAAWVEPTNFVLWAELESGTEVRVGYSTFAER